MFFSRQSTWFLTFRNDLKIMKIVLARRFIRVPKAWLFLDFMQNQFGTRIYLVSYRLSVFTNRRISFSCKIYLVSYGFLWLSCAYKSQEINLAARFTCFLMVSYGLSVPAKHKGLFALTIYFGSYKRSLLTNHNK